MRRIGVLGGTLDPIHRGHVDLASAAEQTLSLTQILVIPANVSPHRSQPCASTFHRFAMVALTVSERTGWRASDMELRVDGPSFTSATLQRLEERGYPPIELFFIIGADAFADVQAWNDYPKILDRAHFAVVSRPGHSVDELPVRLPQLASRMVRSPNEHDGPVIILIDAPTADVSSTAIRRLRAEGKGITGLVEPNVEQHILQHGLYAPEVPGRRRNDSPPQEAASRLHGKG